MSKLLCFVLATACCLALGNSLPAAESPWETVEWGRMSEAQKFKWAIDLYRMDRAADSAEALKRVVADGPAPRVMADMRDMLDPVVRAAMVADPKTADAMKQWLKLYGDSIEKLRVDDAYVTETVAKLTSADLNEVDVAVKRLEQLQEFAAAKVCRMMMDSQKATNRAAGRSMLMRLGRAAVLPTIQCLGAKDDSLRTALLGVLGDLQDVRAQAAIVRIARDPKTNEEVRKAANDALSRIIGQPRPPLPLSNSVTVNYWWLADAFLHERPCALPTMEGDALPLWQWSDEKKDVAYRLVPRKLYKEKLAENACFDGLAVDKSDVSLRAMLIAAYYSEKLELLGTDVGGLDHALDMAILVGGKQALVQCMDKAVLDDDLGIAVQAADAIGAVGAGKGFTMQERTKAGNPLLAALAQEDRGLCFAAARAVVFCRPQRDAAGAFDSCRDVLPALSWGLMYDMPDRTVLIIHPDEGVVNYYKAAIGKLGHTVEIAGDLGAGMKLAASLPRPDVVLLSGDYLSAVDGLKGVLGSNRIPFVLIVAPDKEDSIRKAAGREVSGVLVNPASDDSIRAVLKGLFDVPEKRLVKDLIPKISEQAAVALSKVNPADSPMPMSTTAPALTRALASKDDAVRIPALKALGHVADPETSIEVLAVAADPRNAKDVRLTALDALGQILEAQRKVPPGVFKDLVPISSESDAQISIAAARAIAAAKFDPAQFTDLMVLKRVQEIKAGTRPE